MAEPKHPSQVKAGEETTQTPTPEPEPEPTPDVPKEPMNTGQPTNEELLNEKAEENAEAIADGEEPANEAVFAEREDGEDGEGPDLTNTVVPDPPLPPSRPKGDEQTPPQHEIAQGLHGVAGAEDPYKEDALRRQRGEI